MGWDGTSCFHLKLIRGYDVGTFAQAYVPGNFAKECFHIGMKISKLSTPSACLLEGRLSSPQLSRCHQLSAFKCLVRELIGFLLWQPMQRWPQGLFASIFATGERRQ